MTLLDNNAIYRHVRGVIKWDMDSIVNDVLGVIGKVLQLSLDLVKF